MVPIDHFDVAAQAWPTETAIVDGSMSVSYAVLTEMSWRIAGVVASYSEGVDDAIPAVIYSPNDYRVLVAMVGVMRAGGVIVPLHGQNDVPTSVAFLSPIQPRLLFYHSSLSRAVEQIRAQMPSLRLCICLDRSLSGDRSLEDVVTTAQLPVPPWIDCSGNRSRPMYYWATSGTTGPPKVVVEDCGCFDVMLRASRQRRGHHIPVGAAMALAPMSHGGGPSAFATLTLGGTVIVMRDFDPRRILETIQRYRVRELWLPPTALTLLLDCEDIGTFDLSSLRTVLLGTAGISAETLTRAVKTLGPCIAHSYGQIEASFVTFFDATALAASVAGEHPERLRSSGRTMNVNRLGVADEEGTLLPPGSEGEIVVRGPCVKPYLDPTWTASARRDGWHRTGDIGFVDQDGYVYVTGRVKDVINMAGFKVAAGLVERVIEELDEVRECAVVPAPDPVRGEVIRAIVTAVPGLHLDASAVIAHCRSRLGARKTPQFIEVWPELPRTPAGKVDKRRIRSLRRSL